jgi:phosphohistidine phosphatase
MKTIFLIRHAKAESGQSIEDEDRKLTEKGKSDAVMMAKRLQDREIAIEAFVSSPAKRALKTCKLFAEVFRVKNDTIIQEDDLYMPEVVDFENYLSNFDDDIHTIAIFSHNPGITEFANSLNIATIDNMPTCSIFAFRCETDHWSEFSQAKKNLLFFDYPKIV